MTSENQTIVTSYEQLGLGPSEIAEATGYDLEAIKGILLACSQTFRERNREAAKADENGVEANHLEEFISDDEFKEFTDALKNLARNSDNDVVRERVLRTLVNEKLGRNKGKTAIKRDQNLNIITFNVNLQKAREAKAKALKELNESSEVIDITPTKVEMVM